MTFDYIITALLISFFVTGWLKGIFRSLIGPISFIFFGLIAIIHFDLNENFIESLILVTVGTTAATIVGWFLWMFSRKSVPAEERYYLFWGSRLAGGIITLAWRGMVLALLLILIMALPETIIGRGIKQFVTNSTTYSMIQMEVIPKLPYVKQMTDFIRIFSSPTWSGPIKDTERFQHFMSQDKIQKLLRDPDAVKEIESKDLVKLLSNPRVVDVIKDEALMREFAYLAQMAFEEHTNGKAQTAPSPATP